MDETLIDTLLDKMGLRPKLWSLTPSGEEILKRLEMSEEEWEAEKEREAEG
ncbi:hypothetical protein ES703_43616 [subsurface metagenome]